MEQLLAVLVVALVAAWAFRRLFTGVRRQQKTSRSPDVTDPAQQLAIVSQVKFERQPLLNKTEFQVLLLLEAVVHDLRKGHRVMAQTSLGEILRPRRHSTDAGQSDLAYRSINSKRVDFIVVDQRGLAVLGVEYQGSGHYQGTALMRDAVKREVFRSAGIPLIEIPARFEQGSVAREVRRILNAPASNTVERAVLGH
jgi:hypothetical protein